HQKSVYTTDNKEVTDNSKLEAEEPLPSQPKAADLNQKASRTTAVANKFESFSLADDNIRIQLENGFPFIKTIEILNYKSGSGEAVNLISESDEKEEL